MLTVIKVTSQTQRADDLLMTKHKTRQEQQHQLEAVLREGEGVAGFFVFCPAPVFFTLFHLRFHTHAVQYVATVTLKDQHKPYSTTVSLLPL